MVKVQFDTSRNAMTVANQNSDYGGYVVLDDHIAYGEDVVVVVYIACNSPMSTSA
jgi:hypothetical protein